MFLSIIIDKLSELLAKVEIQGETIIICRNGKPVAEVIPINNEIASLSVSLPLLHNDPCDRFIIATAIRNSMIIISSDELIAQYEGVKVVW